MSSGDFVGLVTRLESVTSRLESLANKGGSSVANGEGEISEMVSEYDTYIAQYITPFRDACNKIDSNAVKRAGEVVLRLAQEQKKFLLCASTCSKPKPDVLANLIKPLSACLTEITKIKDENFKDRKYASYTNAINDAVAAFGWITIEPAPGPFVIECANGSHFHINKIPKEHQDKDWNVKLKAIFVPLRDYVKRFHTTGVMWNLKGPAATVSAAGAPPPPPPPAPAAGAAPHAPVKEVADVSALLSDLNKGSDVTRGLKKVSDDMKTHKNPNLRLQSAVPYKAVKTTAKVSAPTKPATQATKQPKFALEAKKWVIEYQKDNQELVIENAQMKQTVYIYKCENCLIKVNGKVNSIMIDTCKKTSVVFDKIISSVEFINSQSVKAQALGVVPTVMIEKTDGCQLYLNEDCKGCSIITAKSTEMNISLPNKDGDYVEYPIAEQFKTCWDGQTFVTQPNESAE